MNNISSREPYIIMNNISETRENFCETRENLVKQERIFSWGSEAGTTNYSTDASTSYLWIS